MNTPPKDPHAVALGRKGGAANTPAQLAARRKNALKGGVESPYRVTEHGATIRLEHEARPVNLFSPARLRYLATWLFAHRPRTGITAIDRDGTIHTRKE